MGEEIQQINEWKQQLAALRQLADEQAAELAIKTHELEIEAALEKIRNRSLGMHHSVEIKEVVSILFEKLKELNLVFDGGAAIHLYHEGSKNAEIWVASPELDEPICVKLPYDEIGFENNPMIQDVWNAKETGAHIYNKVYSFEEKNIYFNYVFRHNDFITIPAASRQFILQAQGYTASFIAEKKSLLGANSWTGQLFSDNDFDVLKRIARVFEQAYIRFLDLQKAEAQSREAQVETSLERVRGRMMAMHHSEDLPAVMQIIIEQFAHLGINSHGVAFIPDNTRDDMNVWIGSSAQTYPTQTSIPFFDHPVFKVWKKAIADGLDLVTLQIGKEETRSWWKHFVEKSNVSHLSDERKNFLLQLEGCCLI